LKVLAVPKEDDLKIDEDYSVVVAELPQTEIFVVVFIVASPNFRNHGHEPYNVLGIWWIARIPDSAFHPSEHNLLVRVDDDRSQKQLNKDGQHRLDGVGESLWSACL